MIELDGTGLRRPVRQSRRRAGVDGYHLIYDANGITADVTEAWLSQTLTDLCTHLGLTAVANPTTWANPTSGLLAGVLLLSESHASLHVQDGAVHADIYSCRPYAFDVAAAWLTERLQPTTPPTVETLRRALP